MDLNNVALLANDGNVNREEGVEMVVLHVAHIVVVEDAVEMVYHMQ